MAKGKATHMSNLFCWWTSSPRSAQVILRFLVFWVLRLQTDRLNHWPVEGFTHRRTCLLTNTDDISDCLTCCPKNNRSTWQRRRTDLLLPAETGEFFLDIHNPKVGNKRWNTHPHHQKTNMRSHPSHLDELKATYVGVSIMSTSERKHESDLFRWLTLICLLQYAEQLNHLPTLSNIIFVKIFYKN